MRAYGEYVQILPDQQKETNSLIITAPKPVNTGRIISVGPGVSPAGASDQVLYPGQYCYYSPTGAEKIEGQHPFGEEGQKVTFLFVKEGNIYFPFEN